MLRLEKVSKQYDNREILSIKKFQIQNGIYLISGENGSGKTSLLKILAGLIPFGGDVYLDDLSLKSNAVAYRSRVGWSEAEPVFPGFLTGNEMISFYNGLRASKQDHSELIASFHMKEVINHKTGTYSSGMLKKLSLIIALAGSPRLLVLDEPFITLDEDAVACLAGLLQNTAEEGDRLVLMSSHQEIKHEKFSSYARLMIAGQTISR